MFLGGWISLLKLINNKTYTNLLSGILFLTFFTSSLILTIQSASYSAEHYSSFVNTIKETKNNKIHIIRSNSLAIWDEFFMPITDYPLALERIRKEHKLSKKIDTFTYGDSQNLVPCNVKTHIEPGIIEKSDILVCFKIRNKKDKMIFNKINSKNLINNTENLFIVLKVIYKEAFNMCISSTNNIKIKNNKNYKIYNKKNNKNK